MITFINIATFSAVAFALVQGSIASPHDASHRRHVGLHLHDTLDNSTHTLTKRFDNARFTWFHPGLGACGGYNGDGDFIVALNEPQFAGGSHCYETITLHFGGKSHKAQIVDECPSPCPYGALDLSPALYDFFSDNKGEVYGSWDFGDTAQPEPKPEPKPTTTHKPTPSPTPTPTPSPSSSKKPKPSSSSSSSPPSSSSVASSSSVVSSSSSSSIAPSSSTSPTPVPVPTGAIDLTSAAVLQMIGVVIAGEQVSQ